MNFAAARTREQHPTRVSPISAAIAREHREMIQAFDARGGLVTCDHAAALLGRYREQPISAMARWIVAREVVSFEWGGNRLLPLFQFDRAGMVPRPGVFQVTSELVCAYADDLDVAAWFTRPNCWLGGAVPMLMVDTDAAQVLQAARADRYVARG